MTELLGLQGKPVRVTILGADGERVCRVNGSVRITTTEDWGLDLIDPLPALAAGTPVALEVLVQGDLLWTTTALQVATDGLASSLRLGAPTTLHRGQRRAHPRADLSLPIHVQRQATGELLPAQLRDLSAGGASFQAAGALIVGERVRLVLSLGSGLFLQNLEAEVVRASNEVLQPKTFAVRFQCDKRQEALLAEWINQHLTEGRPVAMEE